MKKVIVMLVLGFTTASLYCSTEPIQDIRKVYAFSGLKLRQSPDMNAKVLRIIPFGESITVVDTTDSQHTFEWFKGTWIKVSYEGRKGYILDSYVSQLPMPTNDYELTQKDADISYPLISWVESNFIKITENDSLQDNSSIKIIQHYEDSIVLVTKEGEHAFEVKVEIPGITLAEAYNLIRSMYLSSGEREEYEKNSIFIANSNDEIHKIKIDLETPVEIKKTEMGVIIKATSYQYICSL